MAIDRSEFFEKMEKLHRSFGAEHNRESFRSKVSEWFEIWERYYSQTSGEILSKMIERAALKFERIPSFAQLISMRAEVMGGDVRVVGFPRTTCSICHGAGLIFAHRNGYSFSFRCHNCENWRGRFDGLPLWTAETPTFGYETGFLKMNGTVATESRSLEFKPVPAVYGHPELSDEAKERIRAASLRKESVREGQIREPGDDFEEDPRRELGYS